MKLYEYGEYYTGDQEDLVITPGNYRIAWINYASLPTDTNLLEYEIKEGVYKTKKRSHSLVNIINTGEEDLVLSFCRRFKK